MRITHIFLDRPKLIQEDIKIEMTAAIDDEVVYDNKARKLEGTFGETIVIPHRATTPLAIALHKFQKYIADQVGEVKQDGEGVEFVDDKGFDASATGFSPIKNLHTTVSALHVIDATDEESWHHSLIKSYLLAKLAQCNPAVDAKDEIKIKALIEEGSSLTTILNAKPDKFWRDIFHIKSNINVKEFVLKECAYAPATLKEEKALVSMIQVDPDLHLEIDCIALGYSGNLGIIWKRNSHIIELRHALSSIGGVLKSGPEHTTTTIGFFPNIDQENLGKIKLVLLQAIKVFNQSLKETHALIKDPTIKVQDRVVSRVFNMNLNDMQLVKFARNDLHPNFCTMQRLIRDDRLCKDYYDTTFPISLVRDKDNAQKTQIKQISVCKGMSL